jgi:hypothetical protein
LRCNRVSDIFITFCVHSKRKYLKIQQPNIKGDKMPIPPFLDSKNAQEIYNFVSKALHLDKILVSVAIYQTTKGWDMQIYYKKRDIDQLLKRLFRLNNKGKNPDTNKKNKVKESELFLLIRKKDGSIKLLGPVDTKADTSKNGKQKAERLGPYLLNEVKKGLGFLISFSRYDTKDYIFIFFAIKKDIIEKGELELYEVIGGYLDSKELKSRIKQITGMKEREFEEKLGTRIFFSK